MRVKTGNEQGHHAGTVGHPLGLPDGLAAAPQLGLRLDLQRALHRSGGGGGDRQRDALPLAGGGGLAAGDRERGHHPALPVSPRARRTQPARVRSRRACSTACSGPPGDRAPGWVPIRRWRPGATWGAACSTWWPRTRAPWRSSWGSPTAGGWRCTWTASARSSGASPASGGAPPRCAPGDRPDELTGKPGRSRTLIINEAMSRMVALALSCDLTRVFSFMFSGSVGETSYWEVGQDQSHHQFTHDEDGEQPVVHAATVFVMQQFSHLLQTLKDTPDGAGNLLDSSVILASSDTADARAHDLEDYPILIAGRGGGRAQVPGDPLPVRQRREHQQGPADRAAGGRPPLAHLWAKGRTRRREPHRHRSLSARARLDASGVTVSRRRRSSSAWTSQDVFRRTIPAPCPVSGHCLAPTQGPSSGKWRHCSRWRCCGAAPVPVWAARGRPPPVVGRWNLTVTGEDGVDLPLLARDHLRPGRQAGGPAVRPGRGGPSRWPGWSGRRTSSPSSTWRRVRRAPTSNGCTGPRWPSACWTARPAALTGRPGASSAPAPPSSRRAGESPGASRSP